MDYKAIINLIKEVNQTGLTKLEIESEGVRIFMEKAPLTPVRDKTYTSEDSFAQLQATVNDMPVNAAAEHLRDRKDPIETASDTVKGNEDTSDAAQTDIPGTKKILSPMVGTFYSQASPDKPPFVKAGDTIKAGQTICIIEAMKLMNEIESEYDGEIVEVLVNNEEMVEYGQPMFIIR